MQQLEKYIPKLLFITIIIVTLTKLSLIGEGFMAFPDESRYIPSGEVLESLAHFDIKGAAANLNATQGRPGETFIKIIPSAVQYTSAELLGMETYESANSYPLFLFNFIIYCLLLILLYKIAILLLKDRVLALFSVLLYCCLINSYIYMRHTLPYDCSLLIMGFALLQVLKATINNDFDVKKMLFLGFTAFFGYVIYPGYVLLFGLVFIILMINRLTKENLLSRIKYAVFYGIGSVICLLLFEVIARIGNTSYIQDSITLSKTITQGDFKESFSFLFKYLYHVEYINGILLIIGLIVFISTLLYNIFKRKALTSIHKLFIVTALLFLLYASAGYFFHKMIWYGRLLHQFIFILTLITAYSFGYLSQNIKYKNLVISCISCIAMMTFTLNIIEYKSYAYPKDIVWKIENTTSYNDLIEVCEHDDSWSIMAYINSKHKPVVTADNIVLINGCYFYPLEHIESYNPFIANDNEKLILVKPHFINYKAYQYEGYNIIERQNIDSLKLKIKVYTTK
ncbi:hypothetical protein DVK85_12165 [Flavobacterium arcticum]|uniref:Glycosyltransferase RgtA/B/C/D-like domain-containing protein n=1 Tax=Flavobacterium arcticum TaxID=1784713 RepID=A0A345HED1_9FLAO|nr:hypothetical protein [Flavobacterium arcticum]AXG74941.1 hypothetical protein DVK85_12165 [Flavobacterium arcticum]KAF2506494.1 hypothetical protein E0W72_12740 [Flavobacterium arcticum]